MVQTRDPLRQTSREVVENVLKSKRPRTIADLARIITTDYAMDEGEFTLTVKEMVREGSLDLRKPAYEIESFMDYLRAPTLSTWLWGTLGATCLALLSVVLTPDLLPFSVIRWLLGSMFVLYLPGFTLMQFLFLGGSEIDGLERFVLSVGLSLVIVPLIGLLLNYLPWGIRLVPITISLSFFVVGFALLAAARKYQSVRKPSELGKGFETF